MVCCSTPARNIRRASRQKLANSAARTVVPARCGRMRERNSNSARYTLPIPAMTD
jgi:hypothetical protein